MKSYFHLKGWLTGLVLRKRLITMSAFSYKHTLSDQMHRIWASSSFYVLAPFVLTSTKIFPSFSLISCFNFKISSCQLVKQRIESTNNFFASCQSSHCFNSSWVKLKVSVLLLALLYWMYRYMFKKKIWAPCPQTRLKKCLPSIVWE